MKQKALTILGSTGTIGVNALKLVTRYPEHFSVVALAAGNNIDLLAKQIEQHRPLRVSVFDEAKAQALQKRLGDNHATQIFWGKAGTLEVAASAEADMVISAIVGAAGLLPTYAAIEAGKDIALANKETLVTGGELITRRAREKGVHLLPVDSEHSAVMQALGSEPRRHLKRVILTASGGPFRQCTAAQLATVTPEQALAHPTWNMGAKITIDSATMMNKGLEIIEALRLFELSVEQIGVVIHPQSIVHSMVEWVDGSVIAQLGATDMQGPLAYAMGYPERLGGVLPSISLAEIGTLTFDDPDLERFPCLRLAYEAAGAGGSLPAVLNAANEICVEAFLEKRIDFIGIAATIDRVLQRHARIEPSSVDEILEIDRWARCETAAHIS